MSFIIRRAPPALVFFDSFEYAVGREDLDKTTPFTAAGWQGVKSEPAQNAHGYLYTVTSIPGYAGAFPGGRSRVLCLEARPATMGGQTDFFLQIGAGDLGTESRETIPGDVWFQWWMYPLYYGSDLSQFNNRGKWLYVGNGTYPQSVYNWLFGQSAIAYNPQDSAPLGDPSQGEFFWVLAGNTQGGSPMVNPTPNIDTNNKAGPTSVAEWMRPNRWTLMKMHIDTSRTSGNRYEMWLRALGTPTWTKVAEFIDGVTPPNFTWTLTSEEAGGHRVLRMPTTIGHASDPLQDYDCTVYMSDFAMATSEAALPVYQD